MLLAFTICFKSSASGLKWLLPGCATQICPVPRMWDTVTIRSFTFASIAIAGGVVRSKAIGRIPRY